MKSIIRRFEECIRSSSGECAFIGDTIKFNDTPYDYVILDYKYNEVQIMAAGIVGWYSYGRLGFRKDWYVKR